MTSQSSLSEKLRQISSVYNTRQVLERTTDIPSIARYYQTNRRVYARFHNREGFAHMGLSKNDTFQVTDLQAQADFVATYLPGDKPARVLELATGKGANSTYLARQFPQI